MEVVLIDATLTESDNGRSLMILSVKYIGGPARAVHTNNTRIERRFSL